LLAQSGAIYSESVNQGVGLQEGVGDILIEGDAKVNVHPTDSPFSKIFRTYFPLGGGALVRVREGKEEGRDGRGWEEGREDGKGREG